MNKLIALPVLILSIGSLGFSAPVLAATPEQADMFLADSGAPGPGVTPGVGAPGPGVTPGVGAPGPGVAPGAGAPGPGVAPGAGAPGPGVAPGVGAPGPGAPRAGAARR